ncbi:MAG: hypothetical protein MUF35_12570 [Candidatus Nanopelagicales bacterium]|nr:hypothetical protein [Candidatus Nanopelagicales bacterium]
MAATTSQIPPSIARKPSTPTGTSWVATPVISNAMPRRKATTPRAARRLSPAMLRALRMLVANFGSSA